VGRHDVAGPWRGAAARGSHGQRTASAQRVLEPGALLAATPAAPCHAQRQHPQAGLPGAAALQRPAGAQGWRTRVDAGGCQCREARCFALFMVGLDAAAGRADRVEWPCCCRRTGTGWDVYKGVSSTGERSVNQSARVCVCVGGGGGAVLRWASSHVLVRRARPLARQPCQHSQGVSCRPAAAAGSHPSE
jgi:hypothetical protein